MLYLDQKEAGVVEAKPAGHTLTGVETQSGKYSDGLPDTLPAHRKPLPFLYETTGAETRFTNLLDPEPRSRGVFSFHTPGALGDWVGSHPTGGLTSLAGVAEPSAAYSVAPNLRHRLTEMPPLDAGARWPVQTRAIGNLEESLALAKAPYDHTETVDKGHGRVEHRECWVITDPDCLDYRTPRDNGPN